MVSPAPRSLFDTLKMLEASGICARAGFADGRVFVYLEGPVSECASFNAKDCPQAAEWLVERAVRAFPRSDVAKVRALLGAALAIATKKNPAAR
jgi:hypothetical protein